MSRFRDEFVSHEHFFALGRDARSGKAYLAIPVSNRLVDYEEYYEISEESLERFAADPCAAEEFVEACRARRKDDLLILKPGPDRGVPRRPPRWPGPSESQ